MFTAKYGPWAVIAGGSDGVGAAFAHELGRRGVNVVLVARRQRVIDELAEVVRSVYNVEARTCALDLSTEGAGVSLAKATDDLEVGLVIYNAGADSNPAPFLDLPFEHVESMIRRNCLTVAAASRHFGAPMVARGRGGLILVSSGAAWAGGAGIAAYCATKAFDQVLAEGLWADWHGSGVDVLALILGKTDTPAYRTLLDSRGEQPTDLADPVQVALEGLDHLGDGPTWMFGMPDPQGASPFGALPRRDAVIMMSQGHRGDEQAGDDRSERSAG